MLTIGDELRVEFVPVAYDYATLAQEFVETIRTGWWTTCLEILPARERAIG